MNFSIFFFWGGGVQKSEYFGGMTILWIFWVVNHKMGLYLGVISMHFRVFSLGQGTEWGIIVGVVIYQIFFWVLEIPDIFTE